ncbi:MAG: hypothetical protein J7502_06335 [Flavisolibacter sp.]|nr:hypothetical protein [Flavisolibacter sp.]
MRIQLQFESPISRAAFALSNQGFNPSEVLMPNVYRLEIIVHPDMLHSILRSAFDNFQAYAVRLK